MDMDGSQILDLPMGENDADARTIREYLRALLKELWTDGEGFSGKRPFGNSGWERDLHKPLVAAKLVKGRLDEDGCLESVDERKADTVIFKAIAAL